MANISQNHYEENVSEENMCNCQVTVKAMTLEVKALDNEKLLIQDELLTMLKENAEIRMERDRKEQKAVKLQKLKMKVDMQERSKDDLTELKDGIKCIQEKLNDLILQKEKENNTLQKLYNIFQGTCSNLQEKISEVSDLREKLIVKEMQMKKHEQFLEKKENEGIKDLLARKQNSLEKLNESPELIFSQTLAKDFRMSKSVENIHDDDFLTDSECSVTQNKHFGSQEWDTSYRTEELTNSEYCEKDANENSNENLYVNNYDEKNLKYKLPTDEKFTAVDKNESYDSNCNSSNGHNSINSLCSGYQTGLNDEETLYNQTVEQQLNVTSVFVPISAPVEINENYDFNSCSLDDIVNIHMNDFEGKVLKNYTSALMRKIEKLNDLYKNETEEFAFLFAISDGTQSDKNQKLISGRMCSLIQKHFKTAKRFENIKHNPPQYRRFYKGNNLQSHGSERSFKYNSYHVNENRQRFQNHKN